MKHRDAYILLLAGFVTYGNYYCYDIPGALNTQLRDYIQSDYAKYQTQINLLYSVYSLPNILIPFFGGILIDKLSPNVMIIVFSLLVCTGQAVFSIGTTYRNFELMLAGRLIFGLGAETLDVAQSNITARKFQTKGLAFALALNLSVARIATAVNDILSPYIAANYSLPASLWIGFAFCIASFLAGLLLIYMTSNDNDYSLIEDASDDGNDPDESHGKWSDLLSFGTSFWYLFWIIITLYGAVVPFFHVCTDFFQQKWKLDPQTAGKVLSVPDWISAVGSPLCGVLIDRHGKRSLLLPISVLIILIAHSFLTWTTLTPYIAMALIGIAYSLFASALWPCVPYLVERKYLGTAYGLLTAALNLALFTFPLIVAQIRLLTASDDFTGMQFFFIALCMIALILSSILYVSDKNLGYRHPKHRFPRNLSDNLDYLIEENESESSDSREPLGTIVIADGIIVTAPLSITNGAQSSIAALSYRSNFLLSLPTTDVFQRIWYVNSRIVG